MEADKLNLINELNRNLKTLETLGSSQERDQLAAVKCIRKVENLLFSQMDDSYTLSTYDQVLRYCWNKMEFAKRQVKNGSFEEGVPFAISVIQYYLNHVKTQESNTNSQKGDLSEED